MTIQKLNSRNIVLILMIVAAAAFRLLSFKYKELSNFSPVWAVALFGGAYFTNKWQAYVVPLFTLFVSDIVLNYLYHSKWMLWDSDSAWLYLCLAIMVFIGSLIRKVTVVSVSIAALVSVVFHWLITDLPWLYDTLYPHTLAGYIHSLTMAIPFEKNMVYSEAVFCIVLFGGFELAKSKYSALRSGREFAV